MSKYVNELKIGNNTLTLKVINLQQENDKLKEENYKLRSDNYNLTGKLYDLEEKIENLKKRTEVNPLSTILKYMEGM